MALPTALGFRRRGDGEEGDGDNGRLMRTKHTAIRPPHGREACRKSRWARFGAVDFAAAAPH